ncbi:MAG: YnbE family lipoprotein [Pseudomonadota bacterium]
MVTATTRAGGGLLAILVALVATSCATVKVEAPDEPIEVNLNVKIEQEVRIRLDSEIEDLIDSNPDIF